MKISILGCGWLGFALGKHLLAEGHQVKGSTTTPAKLAMLEAATIEPFLIKVEQRLEGEQLTDFFESDLLVLNIPPKRSNPNIVADHTAQMKAIMQAVERSTVQKMIFVSSTSVYGNTNTVVTEETPAKPERASGKALVLVENHLKSIPSLQLTILRMAGLVGGDRKAGRFLAGKTNVSNGNAYVNLVHRADCIGIIEQVIIQEKWGNIYNVCADEHPLKKDYYIAQAIKEGLTPPTFLEASETAYKIVSNQKVKSDLNYQFIHPDPMDF